VSYDWFFFTLPFTAPDEKYIGQVPGVEIFFLKK
jgi:hypothetical protein